MSDCSEGSTGLRQTGSSKIQICLENARETGGRRTWEGGLKTVINCVTVNNRQRCTQRFYKNKPSKEKHSHEGPRTVPYSGEHKYAVEINKVLGIEFIGFSRK